MKNKPGKERKNLIGVIVLLKYDCADILCTIILIRLRDVIFLPALFLQKRGSVHELLHVF